MSKSHRVYALDLIGHGLTDKPEELCYSIEDFTKHVIAFMDKMGFTTANLIGNSLGARIAMECAAIAPERVSGLVLSAPAAVEKQTLFDFRLVSILFLSEIATAPNRIGTSRIWNSAFVDPRFVTKALVAEKVALAKLPGSGKAFLKGRRNMVELGGFKAKVLADTQAKARRITIGKA